MRDRPIHLMISAADIQKRVDEVAREITEVYGQQPITIVSGDWPSRDNSR